MNDIITYKEQKTINIKGLNTLLYINIYGDGLELLDYKLDPDEYKRIDEETYKVGFKINGVFWSPKSIDYINDILARFTLSMKVIEIETKTIKNDGKGRELSYFQNLESISKEVFIPNHIPKDDFVFYSIKIWVETQLRSDDSLIPYSMLENYAIKHFLDYSKDFSTLKSKCRSIWKWYDERDWKPTMRERKYKNNKEKYEGTFMSRSENMKRINKLKEETSKRKVMSIITGIFQDEYKKPNGNWNITKISKELKIARNTVYKVLEGIK